MDTLNHVTTCPYCNNKFNFIELFGIHKKGCKKCGGKFKDDITPWGASIFIFAMTSSHLFKLTIEAYSVILILSIPLILIVGRKRVQLGISSLDINQKEELDTRLIQYGYKVEIIDKAYDNEEKAYHIGVLYQSKLKDYVYAEYWYRISLRIKQTTKAYESLAMIYEEISKIEEALTCYEKAFILGNKKVAFNLGNLYLKHEDIDNAIHWYVIAIQNKNIDAMDKLGKLYVKVKQNINAAEYFIALIDKTLTRKEILGYMYYDLQFSEDEIQKGYEAHLNSNTIPEELKYKKYLFAEITSQEK